MAKKERTLTEQFEINKKRSELLKKLAPIVFVVFLVLAILCFILAIAVSLGNINEIIQQLNSKKYTGEELQANYNALIEKYGEWTIGNGGAGFQIKFVNIARACFSGFMISNFVLCGVCLFISFVLGKWLMPKLAEALKETNDNTVSLEVLKMAEKQNKGE